MEFIRRLTKVLRGENYYVIIGCGRLGATLAEQLEAAGKETLIIDKNQSAFDKLPDTYGGMTLTGDASELAVLKRVGLESAEGVIVVTNNDNMNAMIAQLVRELQPGARPRIIARLYEPGREVVYRELGITSICPSELSAREISKFLGEDEPW
ncbi:MAG: TrkA family potassium uptake protein [Selenomonadaceae bacterium]|nr:TrkA family potassium uptake protein [Selenomonadaceae bacterium]